MQALNAEAEYGIRSEKPQYSPFNAQLYHGCVSSDSIKCMLERFEIVTSTVRYCRLMI